LGSPHETEKKHCKGFVILGNDEPTLAGVLLLGLIFNILNFENGLGWISLSAYWQSVIRGVFLMIVVVFQFRLVVRQRVTR
jgi:galactofuranose transport system permease protein